MKYFLSFAALLVATVTACGQITGTAGETETGTVEGHAPVIIPAIPEQLSFAGERVPLENYDTRESLLRELTVSSYMHSRTLITLLVSRRYFSIIEPILERNGIPADFKYLCVAESGLDPNVVSSAKAAGLWQIMPGTGRDFGLEVGAEVDDRYDIEKATEVACAHLLKSKEKFGSWTLAAAAYNLGDAGVEKRMGLQAGIGDYYDLWFPDETRRYMFRILSFKLLFEDPAAYGYLIGDDDYYKVLDDYHIATTAEKNIKWPEFAAQHGTTYKMLRELNHWIRDYAYANAKGRTLSVKIPNEGVRREE